MPWQTNATLPADDRQIIIRGKNKQTDRYEYNIVFYHEPMKLWYGGPGMIAKREEIEQWFDIQAIE
jgi:hypothetical protein